MKVSTALQQIATLVAKLEEEHGLFMDRPAKIASVARNITHKADFGNDMRYAELGEEQLDMLDMLSVHAEDIEDSANQALEEILTLRDDLKNFERVYNRYMRSIGR